MVKMLKFATYEEEQKKNPELKEVDIEYLQQWAAKQPHLPKITDSEMAVFLHSNYYRIEPTKTTIDNYYTCRTHVPEFFGNRDPLGAKEVRSAMKMSFVYNLDATTKEGYHVIVGRLLDFDPSVFNYNNSMKFFNMVLDLWMASGGTTKGHIMVLDMQGVVLGHVARLSPMGIKKYLYYLQEALPVRLKGLHFTNSVPVMDLILAMMKPFMKKELMDMLHIHTSIKGLSKFIPAEALPNEMGGKAGPIAEMHQAVIKRLEDHRDWFLTEEKEKRADESKRPGKGKSAQDLFGVEGVFKKLEID